MNSENKELKLAWDFVNFTDRNIFLTGKAGTGKTTFLHNLKQHCLKRMVVVAPTGVAAINAKGVTIHSFFQLPFGPIVPNQEIRSSKDFRFSKTKINIIKSLDLLIIDEISMVRADLLDGVDAILKRYKKANVPFGGVQVLMIGDLQQLSPVIRDQEWHLLKSYYQGIYFFHSQIFKSCKPLTIELTQIYRQDNPLFINILNEVRNNSLTHTSAEILNKRFSPEFIPQENEGYVFLTTHNHKAERINFDALSKLNGKSFTYNAKIQGKFPSNSYPNNESFQLKVGAQIMFIKNDSSPDKRYYNGKIGKVVRLDETEVVVQCPMDDFEIITTPEVWENFDYVMDNETNSISENKIGSFSQMPLRLAWAITIHKSQGLTFEKAIIDAEDAFAHGQTYVALSRCKSLEGLVLRSKIKANQIITDSDVLTFNQNSQAHQPNNHTLKQSQRDFQFSLIAELFDFHPFLYPINRLLDIYYKNQSSIQGSIDVHLTALKLEITELLKINNSFISQIKSSNTNEDLPEDDKYVQARFIKAINFFKERVYSKISEPFKLIQFTTDNNLLDKELTKHLTTFETLLSIKHYYYSNLQSGFNTANVLKVKADAVLMSEETPKQKRKLVIPGTANQKLFELLRGLRGDLAEEHNQIHFQIFTQKSLYAMCELLPTTKKELKEIHGMGKARIEKYGDAILEIITAYCETNNVDVSNRIPIQETSTKTKIDTKKVSLDLFQSGKTIEEIAITRELTENTIFGHLAAFVPSGKIKVVDLMSEARFNELKQIIPTKTFESLTDLKNQLDEKFTYAELRLVLNSLEN